MLSSWKVENGDASSTKSLEGNAVGATQKSSVQTKSSITGKPQKTSQSIVDESLTMKGDLESAGDILVKGTVKGNINCKILIIDRGARVDGGIDAQEVIVRGRVRGEIKADRVHLEDSADVECDIYQNTFLAEEGAHIRGALKSKDDWKKSGSNGVSGETSKGTSNAGIKK